VEKLEGGCSACKLKALEEKAKKKGRGRVTYEKCPWKEYDKGVNIFYRDKDGIKEWMFWMKEYGLECECKSISSPLST
jgi:hypothetical protein